MGKPLAERFWSRVRKSNGCWEWLGARASNGYGNVFRGREATPAYDKAHRVAYELSRGPILPGMVVMHACDNRACVNPDHLALGTVQDNASDMVRKGRAASGDRAPARLYPERVARGDRNGMRLHPERAPFGDRNGTHTHPERTARGERVASAKLTEAQARSILAAHRAEPTRRGLRARMARTYGIHITAVSHIISGRTWAHLHREPSL